MRLLASHSHGSVPVLLAALGRTTQHSYVFAHTLDAHPCLPPPLSALKPQTGLCFRCCVSSLTSREDPGRDLFYPHHTGGAGDQVWHEA